MTAPISFAHTPTLTGASVELRPLGPEHADDLLAALADLEMLRLTGTHATFDREQIERHCATRTEQDDRLDFAIIHQSSGAFLGDLAINEFDDDNRSCGLRIALRADVTGRGYGTEAIRLIVDYVFDAGLHRIALEVYAFNPRARRAYEKVGFRYEGTLRNALLWEGKWVDAELMSLLSTDPRSSSRPEQVSKRPDPALSVLDGA